MGKLELIFLGEWEVIGGVMWHIIICEPNNNLLSMFPEEKNRLVYLHICTNHPSNEISWFKHFIDQLGYIVKLSFKSPYQAGCTPHG